MRIMIAGQIAAAHMLSTRNAVQRAKRAAKVSALQAAAHVIVAVRDARRPIAAAAAHRRLRFDAVHRVHRLGCRCCRRRRRRRSCRCGRSRCRR